MTQELTLNAYQEKAMTTCMDSCDNFSYMMLNLVAEIGEFASKVAKRIRKEEAEIENNVLCMRYNELVEKELMHEAGDILWQLSGLCHTMGWKLEDVAQANLHKLAMRKQAGTIDGDGDGIYDR
jgi:NTP pyrophosphatase (non-canonical NTP hydrolase)